MRNSLIKKHAEGITHNTIGGVVAYYIIQGMPYLISWLVAQLAYLKGAGLPGAILLFILAFALTTFGFNQVRQFRSARREHKDDQQPLTTGQTEIEKALIQCRADFNNLQQQYTKLSEGVGGKRQQLKEETRKYLDMRSQKESVEKALAQKESEVSSLKHIDIQNDLYVTVRARFDELTSDNRLSFQVHVFNGSPRRISIESDVFQNHIKGFILAGDRPLPTKPTIKEVTQFDPPSRLTVLTIEQQLAPDSAKELEGRLSGGSFVQFMFTDLEIYMTVEGSSEKRRLPLPGGVDCQKGFCSNRVIVGKANWTLPGKK
jgi:uncharacterized membrane-anchored protein YhcB (DUF1043 family)